MAEHSTSDDLRPAQSGFEPEKTTALKLVALLRSNVFKAGVWLARNTVFQLSLSRFITFLGTLDGCELYQSSVITACRCFQPCVDSVGRYPLV